MSISDAEALASLRILIAIANADGTVHSDERRSLAAAVESLALTPSLLGGKTVEQLLAEDIDLDAQLAVLKSPDAREQIYRSAFFMAHADGACTPDEAVLLEKIAAATNTSEESRAALDRIFTGRASSGAATMSLAPIADPEARSADVKSRAFKYAVVTAALGAFPIPGIAIATDLAVIGVQLKMVRDIGALWGHNLNLETAKSLLYTMGLGTGARLAVNNLAKLIPGWGSVIGATTSFASTYALATVIDKFFAEGEDPTKAKPEDVRTRFKAAEEIARSVYADHKDIVIASTRTYHTTFDDLTQQLKDGKLTQAEFDAKVAALA